MNNTSSRRLVLASGSPRRRELLTKMGYTYEILKPDVDENVEGTAREIVLTLAERKAKACAAMVPDGIIIASDTLVSLNDRPLGKPADEADAHAMLRGLSGREHEVFTGVCVLDTATGESLTREDRTGVVFREMTDEEIDAYIATGEPMDKAGAYAIQGGAAAFTERLDGSFDNVVGFPTDLVREMLAHFGL